MSKEQVGTYTITILPGDGIGPEVTEQAVRVLQAVASRYGHTFNMTWALVGLSAIEAEGAAISDATMQLCQRSDAILFGAIGDPLGAIGDPPRGAGLNSNLQPAKALLRLRKELELFANLRPVRPFQALLNASSIKAEVLQGTDLLVVRELASKRKSYREQTCSLYANLPADCTTVNPAKFVRHQGAMRPSTPCFIRKRRSSVLYAQHSHWQRIGVRR